MFQTSNFGPTITFFSPESRPRGKIVSPDMHPFQGKECMSGFPDTAFRGRSCPVRSAAFPKGAISVKFSGLVEAMLILKGRWV